MAKLKIRNNLISDLKLFLVSGAYTRGQGGFLDVGTYCIKHRTQL